jgi:aspartyl-tRNA(Asn)/glutamyl-tRNA(Gln) amidotransferase subunit C
MPLQTPAFAASTKPPASAKRPEEKPDLKLTEKEVLYVADLANLSLSAEEIERMGHQLGGILEHMDKLAEIDTEGVAPMTQFVVPQFIGAEGETDTLREDIERPSLANELALENAPVAAAGFFKVPKVIERS